MDDDQARKRDDRQGWRRRDRERGGETDMGPEQAREHPVREEILAALEYANEEGMTTPQVLARLSAEVAPKAAVYHLRVLHGAGLVKAAGGGETVWALA